MNRSEMTEIRTGLLDPRRPWTVRSKQASLGQAISKRIKTSSHDSQFWSSLAFSSTARPTTQVAQEILPRKHCGPYLEHICDWPHQEAAQRTPKTRGFLPTSPSPHPCYICRPLHSYKCVPSWPPSPLSPHRPSVQLPGKQCTPVRLSSDVFSSTRYLPAHKSSKNRNSINLANTYSSQR